MPKKYWPAFIVYLGLFLATVYFYKSESSYIDGMSVAEGHVAGVIDPRVKPRRSDSAAYQRVVVGFRVKGKLYEVEGRGLGIPRFSDENIKVYYDSEQPERARIKRVDESYFFTLLMFFFIGVGFIGGLIAYFTKPFLKQQHLR